MHRLFAFTAVFCLLSACDETPGFNDWGINLFDARLDDLRPPFSFPEAGDQRGPDMSVPTSDRCAGALTLTLTAGKATVSGTTAKASNEYGNAIRCGEQSALAGPQRYYKVPMTKGRTYRVELTPQFAAMFYLFTDCSKNIINTDCTSGGATGFYSGAAAAGATTSATFTAPATGSFRLAVDSAGATASGAFSLTVTELTAPTHGTCLAPKALTLVAGKVSFKGTTLGSKNENSKLVGCGLGVDFDGPQVYYSATLQAGTWYRFTLAPEFPASLYVFNKAGTCKAANIDADCGGISGTVLPLVSKGTTGATAFRPLSTGTYIVAVDALDPKSWGDFGLTIESFTPPGNMTCSKATALTLAGGKASVKGTTATLLNDLGAHVTCGGPPLVAPQAYYTVTLDQKAYQLALEAPFAAVVAVGSSCLTMAADCGSSGLSGTFLKVVPKVTGTTLFTPLKAGTYTIAVDGTTQGAKGAFELWIQEYVKPTNGACAQPKALALIGSPVVELGSTGPLKNDLAGVACGTTLGPWTGPQAYYKVSLKSGRTYTVTLSPETSFDPALYAFEASTSCATAAVNTACKGQSSDKIGGGLQETLTLALSKDTEMVLVVDSWSPSEVGKFSLNISWK